MSRSSPPPPLDTELLGPEYSNEVTQASLREIEVLALTAKHRGPVFYVIGGWAAWNCHHGLGSRDIDVVFPRREHLEVFLEEFYRKNGYEREGGLFEASWRKSVTMKGRTSFIEIDAAAIDQGRPFHEGHELLLPYSLA